MLTLIKTGHPAVRSLFFSFHHLFSLSLSWCLSPSLQVVFGLFVDESQSQEVLGTGLIKARSKSQIPGLGPDSGHWESLECRWERKGISTVSIVRPLPRSARVRARLISGSKWKRSDCDAARPNSPS